MAGLESVSQVNSLSAMLFLSCTKSLFLPLLDLLCFILTAEKREFRIRAETAVYEPTAGGGPPDVRVFVSGQKCMPSFNRILPLSLYCYTS